MLKVAEQRLEAQEIQVIETKKTVNRLCEWADIPARYPDLDFSPSKPTCTGVVRGDEYYEKPLAWVVRQILEARHGAGLGPATVDEIYAAMEDGSYQFEIPDRETAKRGLHISLAKNSSTFHKLPSGKFGMREWYPGVKEPKADESANGNGHHNGKPRQKRQQPEPREEVVVSEME
jgi:hypothetical protein